MEYSCQLSVIPEKSNRPFGLHQTDRVFRTIYCAILVNYESLDRNRKRPELHIDACFLFSTRSEVLKVSEQHVPIFILIGTPGSLFM